MLQDLAESAVVAALERKLPRALSKRPDKVPEVEEVAESVRVHECMSVPWLAPSW